MSQEIKVTGMVLQDGNIGEYDKRIVLLTKERGRISAFEEVLKKQPASMRQPVSHLRLESFLYMREKILLIRCGQGLRIILVL